MSHPLIVRSAARAEFDEATDWYERRQAGLGDQFVAAVTGVFDQITADPFRYAVAHAGIRGVQVPGFPSYCVYYRVRPARVAILSVFHASRDPAIWQSRV